MTITKEREIKTMPKTEKPRLQYHPELMKDEDVQIMQMIDKLRYHGVGEAYSEKGKRNPIRDDTGLVLNTLVRMNKPDCIVELGTAYGLSALWMALENDAVITTCEFDENTALQARKNMYQAGLASRVDVQAGDAGEMLKKRQAPIHMLFLDHEKRLYLPHFKLAEGLMLPGGIVIADNVNDRRDECYDFLYHMNMNSAEFNIIPTECGLMVAKLK